MRRRCLGNAAMKGGVLTTRHKSDGNNTVIINPDFLEGFIKMYVDGQEKTFSSIYDFGDTEEHEVMLEFGEKQTNLKELFYYCNHLISTPSFSIY